MSTTLTDSRKWSIPDDTLSTALSTTTCECARHRLWCRLRRQLCQVHSTALRWLFLSAFPLGTTLAQTIPCDDQQTGHVVDGQQIQRPVQADTAPSNASAQCGDSSCSLSTHRRGTYFPITAVQSRRRSKVVLWPRMPRETLPAVKKPP